MRRATLLVDTGRLRLLLLVTRTTATNVGPLRRRRRRPVIGMPRIHRLALDRGLLLLLHLPERVMNTNALTVVNTPRQSTADDPHHQRRLVMLMTIRLVRQVPRSRRTATDVVLRVRRRVLQLMLTMILAIKALDLVEALQVLATAVACLVALRRLINLRVLVEPRGNTLAMVATNLLATGDSKKF